MFSFSLPLLVVVLERGVLSSTTLRRLIVVVLERGIRAVFEPGHLLSKLLLICRQQVRVRWYEQRFNRCS